MSGLRPAARPKLHAQRGLFGCNAWAGAGSGRDFLASATRNLPSPALPCPARAAALITLTPPSDKVVMRMTEANHAFYSKKW